MNLDEGTLADPTNLDPVDEWLLDRLAITETTVREAYDAYDAYDSSKCAGDCSKHRPCRASILSEQQPFGLADLFQALFLFGL